MNMSYITVGEVIFILVILSLSAAIIFTAGLWRAIELQNTFQDLALKVGLIQGTLDVIQTVNLEQINFSFDALRSSVYDLTKPPLTGDLTINDWALCTSYPFPQGNSDTQSNTPLPPYKNSTAQNLRCLALYAKTELDLLENN